MTEAGTKKAFTLATPVEFGGTTYKSVSLRRPKGREVRALRNRAPTPGIGGDLTFEMMASLAEIEEGVFDEMDAADVRKIEKWLEDILGN